MRRENSNFAPIKSIPHLDRPGSQLAVAEWVCRQNLIGVRFSSNSALIRVDYFKIDFCLLGVAGEGAKQSLVCGEEPVVASRSLADQQCSREFSTLKVERRDL